GALSSVIGRKVEGTGIRTNAKRSIGGRIPEASSSVNRQSCPSRDLSVPQMIPMPICFTTESSGSAESLEVAYNRIQRNHVTEVDIDVEQVNLVHDLAPFSHGFAGHDDPKAIGSIPAGRVYAVACAYSCYDQGVDSKRR